MQIPKHYKNDKEFCAFKHMKTCKNENSSTPCDVNNLMVWFMVPKVIHIQ